LSSDAAGAVAGSGMAHRPATAGALVVIAEFDVKPDRQREFLALALGFADQCLAREPGCRQFDVVALETTPQGVLFYEAYEGTAAFEAHCRSDHLARFKAAFRDLVAGERALRKGWLACTAEGTKT
jgi:quinol monooxygenase YgiN